MIGYSKFLGEEVEELEVLIDEIEKQYATLVDNYMASSVDRYNREKNAKRNKPNQS